MNNIEPLYDGDARIERVIERFDFIIDDFRNQGITVATMIGCLEIVKASLINEILLD